MNLLKIESENKLESIIKSSQEKLQIIFKHSTACPVSRMAFEKLQKEYPLQDMDADIYYVGVIEERPISNAIASKLNTQHESPQALLIKNGKVVFHESHLMIDPKVFGQYV